MTTSGRCPKRRDRPSRRRRPWTKSSAASSSWLDRGRRGPRRGSDHAPGPQRSRPEVREHRSQSQNAVPAEATASIDFRLVPDQSPARIRISLNGPSGDGLRDRPRRAVGRAETAGPKFIQMTWEGGYPGYRSPWTRRSPALSSGRLTPRPGGGSSGCRLREGASRWRCSPGCSACRSPFSPSPTTTTISTARTRNIRLQNLWDGVEMHAALLADLGRTGKKKPCRKSF